MILDHHAVEYTGENKDTTTERHMEHRKASNGERSRHSRTD